MSSHIDCSSNIEDKKQDRQHPSDADTSTLNKQRRHAKPKKMLSTSSNNERKEKVVKYDMTIRGGYLAHVIPVDELVEDIISYHFCSDEDRRKQFGKKK